MDLLLIFINYLGREEAPLDAVAPEQPHESSDPLEPSPSRAHHAARVKEGPFRRANAARGATQ